MIEAELTDLSEQSTVTRRARLPMDQLRAFCDSTYGAVWAALQAQGVAAAGAPFAAYRGMLSDVVDVEAGFPVAAAFEAVGDVGASSLPGGRAAVAMHTGPYEGLADTWGELVRWVTDRGLRPAGDLFWEIYLSDPRTEPVPATWRTRLVVPVN